MATVTLKKSNLFKVGPKVYKNGVKETVSEDDADYLEGTGFFEVVRPKSVKVVTKKVETTAEPEVTVDV